VNLRIPDVERRAAGVLRTLGADPLVHFAVAASAIFAAHAWTAGASGPRSTAEIRVSSGDLRWLEQTWTLQWRRPPSTDEMAGMVTDLVREKLLSTQATELGLAEDDTVVRRRLAQKVDFLVEDTASLADPREDELESYYDAHRDELADPARLHLTQVYLDPARHPHLDEDARALLAALADGADPLAAGDPTLTGQVFDGTDPAALAAQFGDAFANAVLAAPVGRWQGPLSSGHGVHLVRVSARVAASTRPPAEIRGRVVDGWRRAELQEARDAYFRSLLERYRVVGEGDAEPLVARLSASELGRVRERYVESSP
jgi:hypothetical protein